MHSESQTKIQIKSVQRNKIKSYFRCWKLLRWFSVGWYLFKENQPVRESQRVYIIKFIFGAAVYFQWTKPFIVCLPSTRVHLILYITAIFSQAIDAMRWCCVLWTNSVNWVYFIKDNKKKRNCETVFCVPSDLTRTSSTFRRPWIFIGYFVIYTVFCPLVRLYEREYW